MRIVGPMNAEAYNLWLVREIEGRFRKNGILRECKRCPDFAECGQYNSRKEKVARLSLFICKRSREYERYNVMYPAKESSGFKPSGRSSLFWTPFGGNGRKGKLIHKCKECGKTLSQRTKTGLCWNCFHRSLKKKGMAEMPCRLCGKPITKRTAVFGLCKKCYFREKNLKARQESRFIP